MTKKEQLKELYNRLNTLQGKEVLPSETIDSLIQEEVSSFSKKLQSDPTIKILQNFRGELEKFKTDFNLKPIQDSLKQVEQEIKDNQTSLIQDFNKTLENKLKEVQQSIPEIPEVIPFDSSNLQREIATVRQQFLSIEKYDDQPLRKELESFKQKLQTFIEEDSKEDETEKTDYELKLNLLRIELLQRIANTGGGNMNRKITFNGTDYLTKYTDINYKAGTNITFTIANNNTTKQVDVTITASGGAGSGITRSINSISGDTTAGASSSTDYVYLCSGTLVLTLPDAAGNSNLYTIKNVGNGVVTIATTSAQTIDGGANIIMPIQYTSVDVISDTANWKIT